MKTAERPAGPGGGQGRRDRGTAIAELLVAGAVGLVVMAIAVVFVWHQLDAAAAQPETADLQQRARLVAEVLSDSIASAGAWTDAHAGLPPASCCLPVIEPRRIGSRSADPPGTARSDVVTLVRVRPGATVSGVDQFSFPSLTLRTDFVCPTTRPACGLRQDDDVLIFETPGRHDFLRVSAVSGATATVVARQPAAPAAYGPAAVAVAVETRTYAFDPVRRQLRLYDGYRSDVPIVDDVVAVRFAYFGEAGVPSRARIDGASCWFDDAGQPRFGRTRTPGDAVLVPILLAELQDGPWCGEGVNRFDADLLRIRLVRAAIRLQASAPTARGQGTAFLESGLATSGRRFVPDVEVTIDSAPRVPGGH